MKILSVFLSISVTFLLPGYRTAQASRAPHGIPMAPDAMTVLRVDENGNRMAALDDGEQSSTGGAGTGEWTWMGGSSTQGGAFGQSGVYGTQGTPAPGNIPGGRQSSASWTDSSGNLWLFGGMGSGTNGAGVVFNDLWKYDPSTSEWAWISGSNTQNCPAFCGQSGVYGKLGIPAAGNVPGGRSTVVSWIDAGDHLWLYGGNGFDANGTFGILNDLWEFDPATNLWTWMGGSSTLLIASQGQPPVYGMLGSYAAQNSPGGREFASSWTDGSGHFWLFGGLGYYAADIPGTFNDLWEFDPATNQWAWIGGSNTAGSNCPNGVCQQPGVYGTLGIPAVGNVPGSRDFAVTWADTDGHLWLFGGSIPGIHLTYLDDLWEYNPSTNEWAWMGGGSTTDQPGIYGMEGTPAVANIPGGRCCTIGWTGPNNQFWLFGGQGYDANDNSGDLNDLWVFDPSANEWTWMGGSSTVNAAGSQPGVYGTLGVPAAGNIPGSRINSQSWTDRSGNFWLFGGSGADANDNLGNLNDLWRYRPAESTLPVATTPRFNPPAGIYATAQTVTIADTTPGAAIYYTTDGSTPTTSSRVYNAPISVSSSETVKALAAVTGYTNSSIATATYTITTASATPTFNPSGGAYASAQIVRIGDITPGAAIYYTTDGSTPTTSSSVYSAPIPVSSSETIKAIATATGYGISAVGTATYVVASPTTTTLSASSTALAYGQTLTLTAKVTPSSGAAPTGTVTFYNGAASLGKTTMNGTGVTVLTLTPAVGNYVLTASYSGSEDDAASVSSSVAVNVIAGTTATTLSSSLNPAHFGSTVTFKATVTSAKTIPVGSAAFYDGSVLLATKTLASGVASYSTSALAVGSHSITAVYEGENRFNASTSKPVVEVITATGFSIAASPSAQTLYQGEAASYRVTIAPSAGFSLPVALSCTQLPANTTCTFSPATVTGGSGSASLRIQTSAPSKAMATAMTSRIGVPMLAGLFLLFIPRRLRGFRKRWPMFLALLASTAFGAAVTGCGGPGPVTGGTPSGVHAITVSGLATNGSQTVSEATTVKLNVKALF